MLTCQPWCTLFLIWEGSPNSSPKWLMIHLPVPTDTTRHSCSAMSIFPWRNYEHKGQNSLVVRNSSLHVEGSGTTWALRSLQPNHSGILYLHNKSRMSVRAGWSSAKNKKPHATYKSLKLFYLPYACSSCIFIS